MVGIRPSASTHRFDLAHRRSHAERWAAAKLGDDRHVAARVTCAKVAGEVSTSARRASPSNTTVS